MGLNFNQYKRSYSCLESLVYDVLLGFRMDREPCGTRNAFLIILKAASYALSIIYLEIQFPSYLRISVNYLGKQFPFFLFFLGFIFSPKLQCVYVYKERTQRLSTKTKSRACTNMRYVFLPKELVMEIMSRAPSKSLARFRSVSKQFKSLLSDPCFHRLYHSRPPEPFR